MQMTEDKDFMQFGICKEKDRRKLSVCARSMRSTSYSSNIHPKAGQENPIVPLTPTSDGLHLSITTPSLIDDSDSISSSSSDYGYSLRYREEEEEGGEQAWPNSIIKKPNHDERVHRHSLPSSSSPPSYRDSIDDKPRRHSYTEGCVRSVNDVKEKLPKYTCTVQKMGKVEAKVEYETPGNKPRRRKWKDVYLELLGTMLKVYQVKPANTPSAGGYPYFATLASYYEPLKYSLLYNLSLANIKAEVAWDYTKKDHVFRIITLDGPQLLIKAQSNASVSLWIDKIASGSNIALDLESRRMPNLDRVQVEPFEGWSSSTRLSYQEYLNEDRRRRNTNSASTILSIH
ncbi:uncharacterized protein EV154DRAFT_514796 [Mucor mucedo]|uniref:uncharacterized protein n=1 Tax=Mucor mucedo TaxID=29922 RepID=UPI00221EC3C3|nr:uncharacterized protein EV154DRAFT_514796 [Mucor mucedo]KAI7889329.1 hypothetical protein EV154DRAFT_514796 [Mucor mucedo]